MKNNYYVRPDFMTEFDTLFSNISLLIFQDWLPKANSLDDIYEIRNDVSKIIYQPVNKTIASEFNTQLETLLSSWIHESIQEANDKLDIFSYHVLRIVLSEIISFKILGNHIDNFNVIVDIFQNIMDNINSLLESQSPRNRLNNHDLEEFINNLQTLIQHINSLIKNTHDYNKSKILNYIGNQFKSISATIKKYNNPIYKTTIFTSPMLSSIREEPDNENRTTQREINSVVTIKRSNEVNKSVDTRNSSNDKDAKDKSQNLRNPQMANSTVSSNRIILKESQNKPNDNNKENMFKSTVGRNKIQNNESLRPKKFQRSSDHLNLARENKEKVLNNINIRPIKRFQRKQNPIKTAMKENKETPNETNQPHFTRRTRPTRTNESRVKEKVQTESKNNAEQVRICSLPSLKFVKVKNII